MRTNLFAAVLLIALPVSSLFAQQNKKVIPVQPKQVVSDYERTSAAYIEQNKDLLVGFNETALTNSLKVKNRSALAISEIVTGMKIRYIQEKAGIKQTVTPPFMNKALSACDNVGFEQENFTNWEGRYATLSGSVWGSCPDPIDSTLYTVGYQLGIVNDSSNVVIAGGLTATGERHEILTCDSCFDPNAIDPNTGQHAIPYLAPGGSGVSVRLGNAKTGAETERLTYKIDVTPFNSQITYKYAVVYENPTSHQPDEQPFFMVNIKDSTGASISNSTGLTCGQFCFFADPGDTNFILIPTGSQYSTNNLNDMLYRKWTSVGVDLSPFVGQTLYLEFTTGDCSLTGHWGYAYVDASCGVQTATIAVCPNDSIGILVAPVGYSSYQWMTTAGVPIAGATNDTLIVQNPHLGDSTVVQLESVAGAGCYTFLNVIIANYTTVPVQTDVLNLVCNGVSTGYAKAIVDSSVLHGPFTYQWFNSNGPVGTNSNIYYTQQAGTYWVKVLNAGGCGNFLPDTAIVQSIPDYTLNPFPSQLNLCLGQSADINLNPTLGSNTTITTSWVDFLTSNLDTNGFYHVVYTSNAIGKDTLIWSVISNFGCVKFDTVFVDVSDSYIADGTATGGDTLCLGDSTHLGIKFAPTSPELCGATSLNCVLPVNITQLGNGTATNSANTLATAYPSPFGNYQANAKQQYLYRAVELQNAGIKGGLINSIGFNVKTLAPVTTYNNYTVRMGCTNRSAMNTEFDTALAEVYHPKPFNAVSGWNNIDFDLAYAWDGVSNLIIEICMDANAGGTAQNCRVEQGNTNFASSASLTNFSSQVCSQFTGAKPSVKRPNTKFSICGIPADTSRYTYQWNPANGLSNASISHPVATPNASVYYIVTITDTVNGCSDTAGVLVSLPPKNVSFRVDTISGGIPLTINFTNESDPNLVSFFWSYGDGTYDLDTVLTNHAHTFTVEGDYSVSLIGTNSNGCTDTNIIVISALMSQLRVPNVFTPNNDGKNDIFKLDAPGIATFSGIIFNRWGKKVFEWGDASQGWDGKDAKDGTYFYVIKAKGVDGQEYNNTGHVTLTR